MAIVNYKANCILVLGLILMGCKKEPALLPGNEEEHLIVKDNPSDPVDHAIYQFYQATGVPVFYNDTIGRRQIGDSAGIPRYTYIKLATEYSITSSPAAGRGSLFIRLLSKREKLLPLLPMLKQALLPRMPLGFKIHSLLLVDSLRLRQTQNTIMKIDKPFIGFNTIVLKAVDPNTMSSADKKIYIDAVLVELSLKKLLAEYDAQLTGNFYSISVNSFPFIVYFRGLSVLSPDGSKKIEDFGFISDEGATTPRMQVDLFHYLEAVFSYNTADFEARYAAYPLVLAKFKVARSMVKALGFHLAD